jgi:hypothetical protein
MRKDYEMKISFNKNKSVSIPAAKKEMEAEKS